MLPLGETLLLWRTQRRLTQKALAAKAGIPRTALSAIERGKHEVTLRTLRALAVALSVRPGLLVDGVGPASLKLPPAPSREVMERVAQAVVKGRFLRDPREQFLAQQLRQLTKHRLEPSGHRNLLKRQRRATDEAWLLLHSQYPPQVVRSLLERIQDRLPLPP